MKNRDQRKRSTGNGAGSTVVAERKHKDVGVALQDYGQGIKRHLHGQVPTLKGYSVVVHVDKNTPSISVTCEKAGQSALDDLRAAVDKHVGKHTFRNGRLYTAEVQQGDKGALILFR